MNGFPDFRRHNTLFFLLLAPLFVACTFDYAGPESGAQTPDMALTQSRITRYQDGRRTMELYAGAMEIYSGEQLWAAEDISFTEFPAEGEETNSASAGFLLLDEQNEIYTLGGGAVFRMGEDGMTISGDALRWDKKREFLSSTENGGIRITDGNVSVSGYGFAAGTQDRRYRFRGSVYGTITEESGAEESGNGEVP